MSWRLKVLDPDHGETHSSAMAADRAIAFARDLLASGQRVTGMDSSEGEALTEADIKELCAMATVSAA